MQAVRLEDARRLAVVSLDEPEPTDGEVVVRVHACGICGSDLSCYKRGIFTGSILGHEMSGVVAASKADGWQPGDRVVVDPKVPCGTCDRCAEGADHLCVEGLTRGIGQHRQGGFAERLVAPASVLHRVPDALDLTTASLAEPLAVAIHGLRRVQPRSEATLVLGLGPIGLLTIASLVARGAGPILGVDPVGARRALAESLGVSAVEPGDPAIAALDASLIVETSGVASVVGEATTMGRPGARVLLLGVPMDGVEVWPMAWVTREVTIVGSIAHNPEDFTAALDLLEQQPSLGELITARVALDAVPDAFERLATEPDAGKIVYAAD